ncbi:MAG: 4Fe-4S dicluster domain-containing protein [Desulfohalobiaceae bacterium]|nr:4Fe-4S dicluster domain-containing protein [Desulfohalobiaceae bacterium]
MHRRKFLGLLGSAGVGTIAASTAQAAGGKQFEGYPDSFSVLFDSTECIGCRKCEQACNEVNNLDEPEKPFDDKTVLEKKRRTTSDAYTVVNKYEVPGKSEPVYRKIQCNHCMEPACASACFVGAFRKTEMGAVTYDPSVCVGCRYCMIACPFHIPAYEYDKVIEPRVMKCTMCYETRLIKGELPACVEACPKEALLFGKREQLLRLARRKLQTYPESYVQHIYGEEEMGGTNWLYISGTSFENLGMNTDLGNTPAPQYTSGALKLVPGVVALWPLLLGGIYAVSRRKDKIAEQERQESVEQAVAETKEQAKKELEEFKEKAERDKKKEVEKAAQKAREEAQAERKDEEGGSDE